VCVGDLLIAEIKRIIKSSEIMKYTKPKLSTMGYQGLTKAQGR